VANVFVYVIGGLLLTFCVLVAYTYFGGLWDVRQFERKHKAQFAAEAARATAQTVTITAEEAMMLARKATQETQAARRTYAPLRCDTCDRQLMPYVEAATMQCGCCESPFLTCTHCPSRGGLPIGTAYQRALVLERLQEQPSAPTVTIPLAPAPTAAPNNVDLTALFDRRLDDL